MTPALHLENMRSAYTDPEGAKIDTARAFLNQAKEEVIGERRPGRWWLTKKFALIGELWRTRKFAKFVEDHELTELVAILSDMENRDWIERQKTLYKPIVDDAVNRAVQDQEAQLRRDVPSSLLPKWKQEWEILRQKWREDAQKAMETQAKDELAARVMEMANLQVRLTLFLTLSTVIVAVVSLWSSKSSTTTWVTSLATIVGCGVLRLALIPMKSSLRSTWFHKYVDPIVWASLAGDPLGRLCLIKDATVRRNRVATRYKRTLSALVPCMSVILAALAAISAVALL